MKEVPTRRCGESLQIGRRPDQQQWLAFHLDKAELSSRFKGFGVRRLRALLKRKGSWATTGHWRHHDRISPANYLAH